MKDHNTVTIEDNKTDKHTETPINPGDIIKIKYPNLGPRIYICHMNKNSKLTLVGLSDGQTHYPSPNHNMKNTVEQLEKELRQTADHIEKIERTVHIKPN